MGSNVTSVRRLKKETKKELKKHAATIHCSNTLSLLQRKISNALLYHAYEDLLTKEEHEITVKQLCRLIGYQGNNHAAIKDALKELITTLIEWNLVDDETGIESWTASSIIASVSLEGPLCFYAYSPRMKQLLHSPSMFGKIDLVIQSHFRSSYGLALYENCIRYRDLPNTKWFDMDLFKKLMGVPAGKYDIFRDFKRRVLDKAVDEVNTYSDLIIMPEYSREGRKVIKLRFKLKERIKKTRLGYNPPVTLANIKNEPNAIKIKLQHDFHLSLEQIEEVLSHYEETYVAEKVALLEQSTAFQTGRINNLPAYLLSALKFNYQLTKLNEMSQTTSESTINDDSLMEARKIIAEAKQHYHHYREELIENTLAALPANERADLLAQFYESANEAIKTVLKLQRSKYSETTILASPQIKALLRQFALKTLDFSFLKSFENFISEQSPSTLAAWMKLKTEEPEHELLLAE